MAHTPMLRSNWVETQLVVLPITFANSNTETAIGFKIPLGCILKPDDMWLVVDTGDSGITIDVGILSTESGGDANGFIAAASLTTAGTYRVADMITCTDGSSQNYISANTIGVLFFNGLAGADGAGTAGIYATKSFVGDGVATTMTATLSSSGADTFKGRLMFVPRQLPLV